MVLRAMDARCMVRTGEVQAKEQPVTVRSGEVLVVKFVARSRRRAADRPFESPVVYLRPHRYDALELEWVDAETRESAGYRGYSLVVETPLINERCQPMREGP